MFYDIGSNLATVLMGVLWCIGILGWLHIINR